jgi:hypothetical protein
MGEGLCQHEQKEQEKTGRKQDSEQEHGLTEKVAASKQENQDEQDDTGDGSHTRDPDPRQASFR